MFFYNFGNIIVTILIPISLNHTFRVNKNSISDIKKITN